MPSSPTTADQIVAHHLRTAAALLANVSAESVTAIVEALRSSQGANRTVFVMGNGGSAATALHFATDLGNVARHQRLSLLVSPLVANVAALSAIANDSGYEQIFSKQLEGQLTAKDVVFAISASGESPNCLNAVNLGREKGALTIGLVGFDGGALKRLCQLVVHVPAHDYRLVEDVHLSICHAIIGALPAEGGPPEA